MLNTEPSMQHERSTGKTVVQREGVFDYPASDLAKISKTFPYFCIETSAYLYYVLYYFLS